MELTIRDYFKVLYRRWWIICTFVVLACGLTAGYDYFFPKPVYEASTKLIVNNSNQGQVKDRADSNEISSNIMLIETYKEIIATPAIMEKVVANHPEINRDISQLISNVKVSSSTGSQVMSISIRDSTVQQAVQTVNAIAEVFKQEIPKIMNVDNITILSRAKTSDHQSPVSYGIWFKTLIALILSLFVSIGIVFLLDHLDDTLKTEKDVEAYLRLPTLAAISKIKTTAIKKNADPVTKKIGSENIHVSLNR
ncbi:YveK family protein [Cohnella suwonensis]|uniref:YveK family protein n=1 Tax=Cohnella suwonensis TaxID=696072 RepID=A0ABW0M2D2_9BACL